MRARRERGLVIAARHLRLFARIGDAQKIGRTRKVDPHPAIAPCANDPKDHQDLRPNARLGLTNPKRARSQKRKI